MAATTFQRGHRALREFNKALNQLSQQNIQVEYPAKLESQSQLSDVIRERLRREVTTMTGTGDK